MHKKGKIFAMIMIILNISPDIFARQREIIIPLAIFFLVFCVTGLFIITFVYLLIK